MKAHSLMVARLVKPGVDILKTLTPEQAHQWHMVSAISGEAGELLDAFKKHIIYCKELDRENVIEELGDLEFYLEGLRQSLGITRAATLKANLHKLKVRYSSGSYSDAAAKERADKQPKVSNVVDTQKTCTTVAGKKPARWEFETESIGTSHEKIFMVYGSLSGKIRISSGWLPSKSKAMNRAKELAKNFKP
jgi:NTP pyrophosphatase (non-canonical NTP hydrolase)